MNRRILMFGFATLGLSALLGGRSGAVSVSKPVPATGSGAKPSCCCQGERAGTVAVKAACTCCGTSCCCGDSCACGDTCACDVACGCDEG